MKTKWKNDIDVSINQKQYKLKGLIGNNCKVDTACTMRLHNMINGSGTHAFSGARQWPSIRLHISFQKGQEKDRNKLAKILRDCVQLYLEKK